ncbi:hypothetical protein HYH03_011608 [Edaphochlamys debaryana]|uniref:Uncharacterized protein n=1 Tax=Edaphochlamys debaryana TaxID=47281 RepID=A0A835Y2P3_9CHLO|nr:hypothetical protein HYH03_011608 [Edaphochlamys debaryana]|eukprot:KAG2489979.1 hypothetical protein HYH03_011608 [Edaphochlamys debaryana]
MADASKSVLPDHVLRAIRGEMTEEEKKAQLDKSLGSWWKEYAARKNDEEQEHVADSLLYDERCHLPRTAPPPTLSDGTSVSEAAKE